MYQITWIKEAKSIWTDFILHNDEEEETFEKD